MTQGTAETLNLFQINISLTSAKNLQQIVYAEIGLRRPLFVANIFI